MAVPLVMTGVKKRFGDRTVLDGADLRLEAGELVGLLGANGAGKSTLISIASGLRRADAGTVRVEGHDIAHRRASIAPAIGSAPQEIGVYPALSVRENLAGVARLYGLRGRALRARCGEVVEALGLEACERIPAEKLSGGQRRRLHLGMALMHRPRLLFLDEPTVGADVESRRQILALVTGLVAEGAAVVYTTHYLGELEQLPARIALLHDGAVEDHGSVSRVVDVWGGGEIRVRLRDRHGPAPTGWSVRGEWWVSDAGGAPVGERLAELVDGWGSRAREIIDVETTRPTLEGAYVRLIEDHAHRTTRAGVGDVAA